jgi:hypothetical protein
MNAKEVISGHGDAVSQLVGKSQLSLKPVQELVNPC